MSLLAYKKTKHMLRSQFFSNKNVTEIAALRHVQTLKLCIAIHLCASRDTFRLFDVNVDYYQPFLANRFKEAHVFPLFLIVFCNCNSDIDPLNNDII